MGVGERIPQYRFPQRNSTVFSITIDELLSGEEIVSIAEEDNKQRERQLRGPVFGQKTMAHTLFAPKNHLLNLWVLL